MTQHVNYMKLDRQFRKSLTQKLCKFCIEFAKKPYNYRPIAYSLRAGTNL